MKSKKAMEFNFAWIFAIIVGAFILFIAIYSTFKIINSSSYEVNTLDAKQITNILQAAETGLASGVKPDIIKLKDTARFKNICDDKGNFGNQRISISSKILGKWSDEGAKISATNKYLFSNTTEEGKTIYYFIKPIEMPFKISEAIFLSTKRYCFMNAPSEIEEEAAFLMPNFDLNCNDDSVRVCFGSGNCEIKVLAGCSGNCDTEYDNGVVLKDGKSLFYTGNLMYAAIFSSPELYECNVERLIKRLGFQIRLLDKESGYLRGICGSDNSGLISLGLIIQGYSGSKDLILIKDAAEKADRENNVGECKLW